MRITALALRVLGAAALATMGAIHLHLWSLGYRGIPTIGPLFLANAVGGFAPALAILAAPRRLVGLAAAAGALTAGGTLLALGVTTWHGLFGLQESSRALLYWPSVGDESAAIVLLAALAGLTLAPGSLRRHHAARVQPVGR